MTNTQNHSSFTELDTTATEMRGNSLPEESTEPEIPDSMVLALARTLQFKQFESLQANDARMAGNIARVEEKLDKLLTFFAPSSFPDPTSKT